MAEPTEVVAAPTGKPKAVVKSVKTFVFENLKAIEGALPRIGLTPESVARTALSQVYRNPVLETCDKNSLMRSIIEAASLGLSFALGRAYLVPFSNKHVNPTTGAETWRMEAQFMPGYQGLVDLVRRSAAVKSVVASAVYEGDEFEYETGLTEDKFRYKKVGDNEDESKLTHAFCIIRFLDGGYQFLVLNRKKLDKIASKSKAGSGSNAPWVAWFEEMCIKSVVKRVTKLCPASIELSRAIELDNAIERGERQQLDVDLAGDEQRQIEGETQKPPITQQVREAAASVIEQARQSAATQPAEEKGMEAPATDKRSPGRPRKPQETAVAEPVDDTEAKLAASIAERFKAHALRMEPTLAEAEIFLSTMTYGKCHTFEDLGAYLLEHPDSVAKFKETME